MEFFLKSVIMSQNVRFTKKIRPVWGLWIHPWLLNKLCECNHDNLCKLSNDGFITCVSLAMMPYCCWFGCHIVVGYFQSDGVDKFNWGVKRHSLSIEEGEGINETSRSTAESLNDDESDEEVSNYQAGYLHDSKSYEPMRCRNLLTLCIR